MNDREFINEFKKIKVKKICEQLGINYYNVMSGRASYNSVNKVAKELEKQLKKILEERKKYIPFE